jgi:hypothetical protein
LERRRRSDYPQGEKDEGKRERKWFRGLNTPRLGGPDIVRQERTMSTGQSLSAELGKEVFSSNFEVRLGFYIYKS